MKAAFTLVFPLLAVYANASCFSSGEAYGNDIETARSSATEFCNAVPESFRPGQGFGRCYDLGEDKRVNFELALRSDVGARDIGFDECLDGTLKEINGCSLGGETTYANWRYKADPNFGPC